ncbi:hypothetical protein KY285_007151 [Solanum tuberosum]|nr:hypothetical protein KY285_007151 [Solanum tuberosum]
MESQVYTLLQYLQLSIGYFLFTFAIGFSVFSVLLFLLRHKFWSRCTCDICHCYLTSSWRKEFTNLGDWYAHLLRNSPSQTIRIHVLDNIITANPRNVEYMLKTNFLNYPKGKPFSMILGDLLGDDPCCLELSLPLSHFAYSFDLATKLSAERAMVASPLIWKIKRFLDIGTEKKLKGAIEDINVLANEVIRQKRKLGYSNHQDLLSRFMTMVDNDVYLRDIVISFILAGRDTVASGLTSVFWLLTSHPDVELRIREETSRVMKQNDEEFLKFEEMNQMHYLNAVIHENGTFVGKNDRVTYHVYAMGRMENIWGKDYMEFKPERKELALMEMKCVVASMLQHFEIRAVAVGGEPRFDPGLTATMRGGLPVVVRRRRGI